MTDQPSREEIEAEVERIFASLPVELFPYNDAAKTKRVCIIARSLLARLSEVTAERDKFRRKRELEIRGEVWTDEARAAVDEIEERFDISVCSQGHLETWVNQCEAAEARLSEVEKALEDTVAFIQGDIQGPVQRDGILKEARATLHRKARR